MENLPMELCVYCNGNLPSRGYYCPSCRNQVKCKSCGDLLEKNSLGCVMCGASVDDSIVNPNLTANQGRVSAPNKIGFKKQGNSVSLDAELTDLASSYLADTLGQIVATGGFAFRNPNKQNSFLNKSQSKTLTLPSSVSSFDRKETTNNTYDIEEGSDRNDSEILRRIFSYENDTLKLIDPRLKSSGKLDQAVRLILIALYIYEVIGIRQVERASIMEILRYSKLDSSHATNWMSNAEELVKTDNLLELSVPGREVAKLILSEIADPSIETGQAVYSKYKPGKSTKKKKGKNNLKYNQDSISENHQTNKSSSSKPSPMNMLEKLISEGFFTEKRKIKDITDHCKVNKAVSYKSTDFGTALARLVQRDQLKRERNSSDNQYEYYY